MRLRRQYSTFRRQDSCEDDPMWVRLAEWMIREIPNLKAGSPIREIGVRMRGVVTPARPDAPNEMATVRTGRPHEVVYGLTGPIVGAPRDVDTGSRHLGVEFAVAIGANTPAGDPFQGSVRACLS